MSVTLSCTFIFFSMFTQLTFVAHVFFSPPCSCHPVSFLAPTSLCSFSRPLFQLFDGFLFCCASLGCPSLQFNLISLAASSLFCPLPRFFSQLLCGISPVHSKSRIRIVTEHVIGPVESSFISLFGQFAPFPNFATLLIVFFFVRLAQVSLSSLLFNSFLQSAMEKDIETWKDEGLGIKLSDEKRDCVSNQTKQNPDKPGNKHDGRNARRGTSSRRSSNVSWTNDHFR